jgi:hypothetical protein
MYGTLPVHHQHLTRASPHRHRVATNHNRHMYGTLPVHHQNLTRSSPHLHQVAPNHSRHTYGTSPVHHQHLTRSSPHLYRKALNDTRPAHCPSPDRNGAPSLPYRMTRHRSQTTSRWRRTRSGPVRYPVRPRIGPAPGAHQAPPGPNPCLCPLPPHLAALQADSRPRRRQQASPASSARKHQRRTTAPTRPGRSASTSGGSKSRPRPRLPKPPPTGPGASLTTHWPGPTSDGAVREASP